MLPESPGAQRYSVVKDCVVAVGTEKHPGYHPTYSLETGVISMGTSTISMRRFLACPSSVSLEATG